MLAVVLVLLTTPPIRLDIGARCSRCTELVRRRCEHEATDAAVRPLRLGVGLAEFAPVESKINCWTCPRGEKAETAYLDPVLFRETNRSISYSPVKWRHAQRKA